MARGRVRDLIRQQGYRIRAASGLLALCVALGIAGCGGSATAPAPSGRVPSGSQVQPGAEDTALPIPTSVVPAPIGQSRTNLVADMAAGSVLLQAQCASCHALLSAGMSGTGPSLDRIGRRRSHAWLQKELVDPCAHRSPHQSQSRCSQMPSYAGLTTQQRDQIVLYLLAQR